MSSLPIDAHLDAVRTAVAERGAVVVEAEPGAGKTTRIPAALLDGTNGHVVVVEPRRLAARMAATHVARSRGEHAGEVVGYQVRFDDRTSRETRIRYVTEGVLLRQLRGAPSLPGVGIVILDEVHERHLTGDLLLALLADRRRRGGDLALVAMSATLDAGPIAALLDAPTVRSEGRCFDVAVEYVPTGRDDLATAVAKAVRRCLREDPEEGHVLVFLPGIGAIRRAEERCAALARDHDVDLCPLHGELPPDAQDRAVAPAVRRKVILSTNVAESSVTIDGVTAVVDSGLHRVARSGDDVGELVDRPISRASAIQRAGRAGRTAPGRCLRLYAEGDFTARPAFDEPEITRQDLTETRLTLAVVDVDPASLPWLTPPPDGALSRATETLEAIGALDANGITPVGRRLADLPLSPRLGRVLLEARDRGVEEPIASALAVVSEGIRAGRSVDLWHHVDALEEARRARFATTVTRRLGLPGRARHADRARRQLLQAARRLPPASREGDEETALAASLVAGFADRVARRSGERDGAPILALSGGGRALLPERAPPGELFVVLEARRTSPTRPPRAELVAPLPLDVLLEAEGDAIELEEFLALDPQRGRVESVGRMRYRQLVLEETRAAASPSAEAAAILADAAQQSELHLTDEVVALQMRIAWARAHDPSVPAFDDEAILVAVRETATFTVSLADLKAVDWAQTWLDRLPSDARKRLKRLAPTAVPLASGQRLPVNYSPDGPPSVGSYLQDFFGLAEGPRAAGEPIVLELWAPNRRPLQVTTDLAGFWTKHYPDLRRQLSRRYPKHHWPDEPRAAKPVRLKRHLKS